MVKERIILREIAESDTASIIRWRNSGHVRDRFVFREPLTEEMHKNWLTTKVETGEVTQFIISYKNEDIDIGSVYLRDIDKESGIAEYGIFIGEKEYLNKGLGSEACRLILDYAWNRLELKRVFLRVYQDNISAIKSYTQNGFLQVEKSELETYVKMSGTDAKLIFMISENPKGMKY